MVYVIFCQHNIKSYDAGEYSDTRLVIALKKSLCTNHGQA